MPSKYPNQSLSPLKPYSKILLVLSLLVLGSIPAVAALTPPIQTHSVTLGWDAVPEPNIQAYRLYVGTASAQYSTTYEAGAVLSFQIDDLEIGRTYYFSVKAIDTTGAESDFSTELVITIAPPPLPVGAALGTLADGQHGLKWSFPISELGSSPEFVIEASEDLVTWTEVGTVLPDQSIGGDEQSAEFSWPISTAGGRMFYRLTSRNWMGTSTRP